MQQILDEGKTAFLKKWQNKERPTSKLSDYQILKTLGLGTFGRVLLAKLTKTGEYFALKKMKKKDIVQKHKVNYVINEKDILRAIDHPFMVHYHTHFKNHDYVFISMNYVMGGELYKHIRIMGQLSLAETRFYASQVLLAFEYLHYLGIMYRDLKPENVLISHQGFIQIADFTFAKKMDDTGITGTLCGTPEYIAPELIRQERYSYYVDWWTFGILMYEMYFGHTPFFSVNMTTLFRSILTAKLTYNVNWKPDRTLVHLLDSMIKPDWSDRLHTAKAIKKHPFFKQIDWWALYHQKVTPVFVPIISGPLDTRHFYQYEEESLMDSEESTYEEEFADF